MGGARNGCASFGRPVTRGGGLPAWPVAPPKIGGCSPLHARPPKGAAHWRAERCFFRGACPRKKRILVGSAGCGRRKSATLALPGESVGSERPADACGGALPGESVGAERPADTYGVCPSGRVRWNGKAGGCLRASPLGWRGRRKFATLFGSVVGMVFLQRAHVFVLGKIFLKLPHIWRGSFVIQGERGRSHHGLGGPI